MGDSVHNYLTLSLNLKGRFIKYLKYLESALLWSILKYFIKTLLFLKVEKLIVKNRRSNHSTNTPLFSYSRSLLLLILSLHLNHGKCEGKRKGKEKKVRKITK